MTPVAVVTGASAGIGAELARVFAHHGHRVVLVARRAERLAALAQEIAASGAAAPIVVALDLSKPDAADRLRATLADEAVAVRYLVNNAGFGLVGPAAERDRAEQLGMIDLNVRALLDLTLGFADELQRHRGGVLQVASVAGFMPGPGSAVYYATKAFVLSLGEALHAELDPRGVRVTTLCPGPVATEFQARAGVDEREPPWPFAVSAAEVARQGYDGLMRGRRLVVPGAGNKGLIAMARFLPRGLLLDRVEARQKRRRGPAAAGRTTA